MAIPLVCLSQVSCEGQCLQGPLSLFAQNSPFFSTGRPLWGLWFDLPFIPQTALLVAWQSCSPFLLLYLFIYLFKFEIHLSCGRKVYCLSNPLHLTLNPQPLSTDACLLEASSGKVLRETLPGWRQERETDFVLWKTIMCRAVAGRRRRLTWVGGNQVPPFPGFSHQPVA